MQLIILGRSLGQGTFGKVRIGTHTITNEQVAIKILEKDKIKDKSDVERVTREINILKKVRHPNVIQLYEVSHLTNLWQRSLRLAVSFSLLWNTRQEVTCSST
jgi:serine/threonine protein kinase